jgi:hypothetical protein
MEAAHDLFNEEQADLLVAMARPDVDPGQRGARSRADGGEAPHGLGPVPGEEDDRLVPREALREPERESPGREGHPEESDDLARVRPALRKLVGEALE